MSDVEVTESGFVVDAVVLGRAFSLAPEAVKEEMRDGRITSRCETGVDEDAGRWRMSFYRDGRALRLVVDATGTILSQARFPVARSPRADEPSD